MTHMHDAEPEQSQDIRLLEDRAEPARSQDIRLLEDRQDVALWGDALPDGDPYAFTLIVLPGGRVETKWRSDPDSLPETFASVWKALQELGPDDVLGEPYDAYDSAGHPRGKTFEVAHRSHLEGMIDRRQRRRWGDDRGHTGA